MKKIRQRKRIGKDTDVIKKLILSGVVLILVMVTSPKEVFEKKDIVTFLLLLMITICLIVIQNNEKMNKERLHNQFRFNLFIMGFFMTLVDVYGAMAVASKNQIYETLQYEIIIAFKPLVYSIIIYFIGNTMIDGISFEDIKKEQSKKAEEIDVKSSNIETKPKDDIRNIGLTRREKEIIEEIYKGKSNKEISQVLFIAEATVKKHIQNILKKAECNNREELLENYGIIVHDND